MCADLLIRDLQPDDVETLVEIALAAWAPVYAGYRQALDNELFTAMWPDWQANKAGQIRHACAMGSQATVCVAEQAGQVVGFITFYADETSQWGRIGNNAVAPSAQGQGIGTRLYRHTFERLKGLGMRYVKVETGGDAAHAPARRAYEKAGFRRNIPSVEYYREL